MRRFLKTKIITAAVLVLGGLGLTLRFLSGPAPLDAATVDKLYAEPLAAPTAPLRVYHLGHSLVADDMPAMLQQLAETGHSHNSQLGWGTFLKAHWDPDTPINGFEVSNATPSYRDAHEAIGSGEYDALVLTEAVEIRDSIKYMDSGEMLHNWAAKARAANPGVRVYFYETWHPLDDPEGWLIRLDRDLALYWEGEILHRALAHEENPQPIYMIPGGQVMAELARRIEARGGVGPVDDRQGLFSDNIHFNDFGAYVIALTHYAVLYQRSPVGLPHQLRKADGTTAADPGTELALLMQQTVWDVVTGYDRTGVPQAR